MEWLVGVVIVLIYIIGENMDLGELIDLLVNLF